MRAVIVTQHPGEVTNNVLALSEDQLIPVISSQQVLIRVVASSLDEWTCGQGNAGASPILGVVVSGFVTAVGSMIPPGSLSVDDEVIAIVLPDSISSGGWVEFVAVDALDVFIKPCAASHEEACAILIPGIRAHLALYTCLGVRSTLETLLIVGNRFVASSLSAVLYAYARKLSLRVIVTNPALNHKDHTEPYGSPIVRVIQDSSSDILVTEVLKETNGQGVKYLLDLRLPSDPYSNMQLIDCLSVHGNWCTAWPGMQLDPPESTQLYHRAATLSFLSEYAWLAANPDQGRLLRNFQSMTRLLTYL